ncbi:Uncharacterised protein [Mycobacteroides abscessus subsp. abscessus]|nr:Uncharacterised protein [Mycobacteroides abscessus subsp. abscessus]
MERVTSAILTVWTSSLPQAASGTSSTNTASKEKPIFKALFMLLPPVCKGVCSYLSYRMIWAKNV